MITIRSGEIKGVADSLKWGPLGVGQEDVRSGLPLRAQKGGRSQRRG